MSTPPALHPPLTFHPRYCYPLSPTYNTWARLTCADIHTHITTRPGGGAFILNHPLRYVRLVGQIVAVDAYERRTLLVLDDGSGANIDVLAIHGAGEVTAGVLAGAKVWDTVKARGTLEMRRGRWQVVLVKRLEVLGGDGVEEAVAWRQEAAWKRQVLGRAWEVEEGARAKMERRWRREERRRIEGVEGEREKRGAERGAERFRGKRRAGSEVGAGIERGRGRVKVEGGEGARKKPKPSQKERQKPKLTYADFETTWVTTTNTTTTAQAQAQAQQEQEHEQEQEKEREEKKFRGRRRPPGYVPPPPPPQEDPVRIKTEPLPKPLPDPAPTPTPNLSWAELDSTDLILQEQVVKIEAELELETAEKTVKKFHGRRRAPGYTKPPPPPTDLEPEPQPGPVVKVEPEIEDTPIFDAPRTVRRRAYVPPDDFPTPEVFKTLLSQDLRPLPIQTLPRPSPHLPPPPPPQLQPAASKTFKGRRRTATPTAALPITPRSAPPRPIPSAHSRQSPLSQSFTIASSFSPDSYAALCAATDAATFAPAPVPFVSARSLLSNPATATAAVSGSVKSFTGRRRPTPAPAAASSPLPPPRPPPPLPQSTKSLKTALLHHLMATHATRTTASLHAPAAVRALVADGWLLPSHSSNNTGDGEYVVVSVHHPELRRVVERMLESAKRRGRGGEVRVKAVWGRVKEMGGVWAGVGKTVIAEVLRGVVEEGGGWRERGGGGGWVWNG
ncbi:hypothetical protein EDC01DRAFT_732395 [Geopyxis carbonaria]|nr:hypothetical protein EDC01DRAFT_732395 [Geopyxis carbonaria]